MAKLLALDFGLKRCGVAESDELQIIASPLTVVPSEKCLDFIADYYQLYKPEALIIGQARHLRTGQLADIESNIILFINEINRLVPELKIERFDERFTSKMAARANVESGMRKSKRMQKGQLDITSATILLQDYMSSNRKNKNI